MIRNSILREQSIDGGPKILFHAVKSFAEGQTHGINLLQTAALMKILDPVGNMSITPFGHGRVGEMSVFGQVRHRGWEKKVAQC